MQVLIAFNDRAIISTSILTDCLSEKRGAVKTSSAFVLAVKTRRVLSISRPRILNVRLAAFNRATLPFVLSFSLLRKRRPSRLLPA